MILIVLATDYLTVFFDSRAHGSDQKVISRDLEFLLTWSECCQITRCWYTQLLIGDISTKASIYNEKLRYRKVVGYSSKRLLRNKRYQSFPVPQYTFGVFYADYIHSFDNKNPYVKDEPGDAQEQ